MMFRIITICLKGITTMFEVSRYTYSVNEIYIIAIVVGMYGRVMNRRYKELGSPTM